MIHPTVPIARRRILEEFSEQPIEEFLIEECITMKFLHADQL